MASLAALVKRRLLKEHSNTMSLSSKALLLTSRRNIPRKKLQISVENYRADILFLRNEFIKKHKTHIFYFIFVHMVDHLFSVLNSSNLIIISAIYDGEEYNR
jgi:hypothetical protein